MQGYNCIIVYNTEQNKLLFCKRRKDPYKGLFNLVGGKIDKGEDGFHAAYRELCEETGITVDSIQLHHMMDFTYYNQDCYVEVYAGILIQDIQLKEEANPLIWLDKTEDFFAPDRFAGEGNIGHMILQVSQYGMGEADISKGRRVLGSIDKNSLCIGVDGCKGGWIGAILQNGSLTVKRFKSIQNITEEYEDFDEFLIDMVIGLPGNNAHIRPDTYARNIIKERASTIFPAPCRQAVYAKDTENAYLENQRVMGRKFTPLTVGIIPKIREVDDFLQKNPEYKNRIKESHPEVCFAAFNSKTVMSRKKDAEGITERIHLLQLYLPLINREQLMDYAKKLKCSMDDIFDAICLSVTANLAGQNKYEIIPLNPMEDDTGLRMQMVIPN